MILRASAHNRFSVERVTTDLILSFNNWWPNIYKKVSISVKTSGRGIPKHQKLLFKISSYKQFEYSNKNQGIVTAYSHINGFNSDTFSFRKTSYCPALPTLQAYPYGKVPINIKKIQDLVKLEPYIKNFYDEFYKEIFEWPTSEIIEQEGASSNEGE